MFRQTYGYRAVLSILRASDALHCKTIGACGGRRQHLVPKANIESHDGIVDPEDFMGTGPICHWHRASTETRPIG